MALVIDLFDPEGGYYLCAVTDDAAGFESYRLSLWGSPALSSRGARLLPRLRDDDLFVPPSDLDAFEAECRMVSNAAADIAREVRGPHTSADSIQRYMTRFIAVIAQARFRGAGVCIS